jgi:hypothetical protein
MRKSVSAAACTAMAVAALTLSVSCRNKASNEPPVATPSLTLSKDKVPIGSPVKLTYKFTVSNDAQAVSALNGASQWVFVRAGGKPLSRQSIWKLVKRRAHLAMSDTFGCPHRRTDEVQLLHVAMRAEDFDDDLREGNDGEAGDEQADHPAGDFWGDVGVDQAVLKRLETREGHGG